MEVIRVSSPDSYYRQFAQIRGVTIKAAAGVAPETLQMVARVVNLMLDGRADIRECIEGQGSSFVVRQKGHENWGLPGFEDLRGREDVWGRIYNELHGWGGTPYQPTAVISEESLLGETKYRPYDVAIHEFAHTIMNLCFDHNTMRKLDALYESTVDDGRGFGIDMLVDRNEFFAEFSSIYFDAHTVVPRRALIERLPVLFEFLEKVYGELTIHELEFTGNRTYKTQSGISIPWESLNTSIDENRTRTVYLDPSLKYSVEVPNEWELTTQESESVVWSRIAGTSIAGRLNITILEFPPQEFLLSTSLLAGFGEIWQRDYQMQHADWEIFSKTSSGQIQFNGIDWLMSEYFGVESAESCPVKVRSLVGVLTHRDFHFGVTLRMALCESEIDFESQWLQISRSFAVAAQDLK